MAAAEENTRWAGESWGDDERRARNTNNHEAHDARGLCLANVSEYRRAKAASSNNKVSTTAARILTRARPLFANETEQGDWECVTASSTHGELVVHC